MQAKKSALIRPICVIRVPFLSPLQKGQIHRGATEGAEKDRRKNPCHLRNLRFPVFFAVVLLGVLGCVIPLR
jgi:hypothetical protein